MDGSRVMEETMDSLWFFSNIFSSKATILGPIKHGEGPVNEDWCKPMSPTVQNQQNELPPVAEMAVPMCLKCDKPESLKLDIEVVECYYSPSPSPRSAEKGKRMRRRRRSERSLQGHGRKILGELDELGFDDHVKEVSSGSWSSNRLVEEDYGCNQRFGDEKYQMNAMLSISDNMAMKEHLKSWAYAVACIACSVK